MHRVNRHTRLTHASHVLVVLCLTFSPFFMSIPAHNLLAVAVLSRHGARNPQPMPVTIHNVTGDGQINDWGHEMMRRLGERIRDVYYERLLTSFPSAAEIHIRAKSSTSRRCMASAADTLQGLCLESKVLVEGEALLTITHVKETAEFLPVHETFPDVTANAFPDPSPDMDLESLVPLVAQHCDNVNTWLANGNPLPDSIPLQVRERMTDYSAAYYEYNLMKDSIRRSYVQPVLQMLCSDLTLAASSARPSILVYNSHDAMIDMVMQEVVGDLPDGPAKQPFAASLTFELMQDEEDGERMIKVWYNRRVDLLPGEQVIRLPVGEWESKCNNGLPVL